MPDSGKDTEQYTGRKELLYRASALHRGQNNKIGKSTRHSTHYGRARTWSGTTLNFGARMAIVSGKTLLKRREV